MVTIELATGLLDADRVYQEEIEQHRICTVHCVTVAQMMNKCVVTERCDLPVHGRYSTHG